MLVLLCVSGCAHTAHVKGIGSNPSARVDSATFTRVDNDVVFDVQVGLGDMGDPNAPQVLVRAQVPCMVGPVPPPAGFRIVYATFNPTSLSTLTVDEGFITVHRCEGDHFEFSGGWFVEGIIVTAMERKLQPASTPVPITHVEITHVKATPTQPTVQVR